MKKEFKRIFETLFYLFFSTDVDKIYNKISKYTIASFDIFDTLIKRNVDAPEDIFDLVEKKYNENNKKKIRNFKNDRIKAYNLARSNSFDEEVTFEQIYKYIKYSEDQKHELMNLEIKIELELCKKNYLMYDIYKKCVKEHKKVYVITDMYLPRNIIEKILINNNYSEIDKIYISCEKKVTKRTGNLFKKFIDENKINSKDVIHIGDSPLNDFLSPRKVSMSAILIKRQNYNTEFCVKKSKNKEYNILKQTINNSEPFFLYKSVYSNFGYEVFGPLLFGFVQWIHKEIKKDKLNKIYFLARDAKIIMEAYKLLYGDDIYMNYIYMSRKSVILSDLQNVSDFDNLYDRLKSILKSTSTVKDIINVLNLKIENYTSLFLEKNINFEKIIAHLSINEKNTIFEILINDIKENALLQCKLFDEYMHQNKLQGKVAFVDIGWRGTIQYLVDKKNNNCNIIGYYFGINKDRNFSDLDSIRRKGYLFDNKCINDNQSVISLSIGVFESLFLSTEATTIGYKFNGKIVEPVWAKNHEVNNQKIVFEIQQASLDFIKYIKDNNMLEYVSDYNCNTFFENYKNFSINPTKKNLQLFSNLEFTGFEKNKLINNKNIFKYIISPKSFLIDFNNSYCKIMFLKNIFKVKLPYYRILNYLYKKRKK